MKHFAGLDVSLENTSVCVLDADGQIVSEISVVSHADDIFSALSPYLGRCCTNTGSSGNRVLHL